MKSIIEDVLSPIFGTFSPNTNPTGNDYVSKYGNGGANISHIYDYGTFYTDRINVSVFEVILTDDCHLSRARKNIQNTVRQITETYSGAFIVFHYPNVSHNPEAHTWRLSWLKRLDVHREDSPAKRYTYLCGPSYSCRTIAQRFDELQQTNNKTLDSITKAFDVEALSDEFFYNYRALYSKILGDGEKGRSKYKRYKDLSSISEEELGFCDFLERHKGDARYFGPEFSRWDEKTRRDYIKKLMGRLVFLQFLQKKGWMCGNPNYIKSLFEIYVTNKGENVTDTIPGSFLDEVLEPLFFGVLNTKVDDRKALFEKEGWNLKLLDEWKNIPYLNGGLFEQEEFDKPKSAFSNSIFNELFTLFSEYNFTIDENDPNDAEIGIDPEMLGKIFESQLEDNKDKGAFYTPKEIVQYMCKESLIAYLCTKIPGFDDDIRAFVEDYERIEVPERENVLVELKNVKICDPAIGSGAFPMGMLNLLVALREKLGDKTSRYEQKREIIQNNIFGVDVEKGAVDIARLRFWLSIVIDEENNTPHALPNLDYQIVKGNSLLHRFSLNASFKDVFSDYNKQYGTKYTLADYKKWVADYLNTADHNKKEVFRKKIEEIKSCFRSELKKKEVLKEIKLKEKINDIETANLFGLDKRQKQQISELKKQLKELEQKHQDIVTNAVYKDAFEWRFEFPQLLDDNADFVGFDIVIGNPPYFKYEGKHKDEIKYLRKDKELEAAFGGKLNAYKLFLSKALRALVRNGGVICFIFQNSFLADQQATLLRKEVLSEAQIISIDSFPERDNKKKRVFENVKMSVCIPVIRKEVTDDAFVVHFWDDKNKSSGITTIFTKKEIFSIDSKYLTIPRVQAKWIPLLIKLNNTNKLPLECYEGELNMTNHKPYFTTKTSNPKILKGASIQRYYYTENMSQGEIEYLDEQKYLRDFSGEKINHHNCDRIAMQGMTGANDKIRIIMALVPQGYYLANSCNYLIPTKDFPSLYLLALMNSKIVNWFFRCFSTNSNVNGYEVKNLPIPNSTLMDKKSIISLAQKILTAKRLNPQADTGAWEREIDILVYLLYGLTWDEVQIVENSL